MANELESRQRAIQIIQDTLGLDSQVINAIGIPQLMTQVAQLHGMEVTRCDADSGQTGQYYGDLLSDLESYF